MAEGSTKDDEQGKAGIKWVSIEMFRSSHERLLLRKMPAAARQFILGALAPLGMRNADMSPADYVEWKGVGCNALNEALETPTLKECTGMEAEELEAALEGCKQWPPSGVNVAQFLTFASYRAIAALAVQRESGGTNQATRSMRGFAMSLRRARGVEEQADDESEGGADSGENRGEAARRMQVRWADRRPSGERSPYPLSHTSKGTMFL